MPPPVFRFAPSPNGPLHLGHAYSALLNRRMAQAAGGRLLLRIEDIDAARSQPRFETAIFEDLAWLGIVWEEPVRRQSAHLADYRRPLERLAAEGLVYPAFMSRGEVRAHIAEAGKGAEPWPRDPDGVPHYPGLERDLSQAARRRRIEAGDPFAWRLDMRRAVAAAGRLFWEEYADEGRSSTVALEARPGDWGDVVVARKEMPTSYHLSVVVDDALQGITDVVRGEDLKVATGVHRLLQALLGLPTPRYFHHRLILGPDGRKLSKSLGSAALADLRAAGQSPRDISRRLGLD